MNLYKRNLLTLLDFTPEEIDYLLKLAIELKEKKHHGIHHCVFSFLKKEINLIKIGFLQE